MENAINITSVNMYSFVKEMVYGTNYVTTESEFIFERFKGILETYEQACNLNMFRTSGDMQIDPEGVFSVNVIFSQRDFEFPDLHPDNFIISDMIKEARDTKSIVCGNIYESLIKKASVLSKFNGIGFRVIEGGFFEFNGSEKTKAVSAQIVEAYLNGDVSISFDLDKNAPGTLRCYASNIGGAYGKKFKCTSEDRVMTIWFKEMDPVDRLRLEIKNIENKFIDLVTPDEFKTVFAERIYELTGYEFIPLQPKEGFSVFMGNTLDAIADNYDILKDDLIMDVDYEDNDEPEERDYEAEAESARLVQHSLNNTYISDIYEKTPQDEDDDF